MTTEDAKEYIATNNISTLFEGLLTGLMYHRPPDHIQYMIDALTRLKKYEHQEITWNYFIDIRPSKVLLPPIGDGEFVMQSDVSLSGQTLEKSKSVEIKCSNESLKTHGEKSKSPSPLPPISKIIPASIPIVVVLGTPGIGKEELMHDILKLYQGWIEISIPALLKSSDNHSILPPETLKNYFNEGELVPDDIITEILTRYLRTHDYTSKGVVVIGYPRTLIQMENFEKFVGNVKYVLLIDDSKTTAVTRMTWRHSILARPDDESVAAKKKLDTYQAATLPVLQQFDLKEKLIIIDSEGSQERLLAELNEAFQNIAEGCTIQELADSVSRVSSRLSKNSNSQASAYEILRGLTGLSKRLEIHDAGRATGLPTCPIILVAGGPGSGKAKYCEKLIKLKPNISHISMGKILQQNIDLKASSEALWSAVHHLKTKGEMAPTEMTISVLKSAIEKLPETSAIIVDGFPRDISQVKQLYSKIGAIEGVILIDKEESTLTQLLTEQCGDKPEFLTAMSDRLLHFRNYGIPALSYFDKENKLYIIDGEKDFDTVVDELVMAVDKILDSALQSGIRSSKNKDLEKEREKLKSESPHSMDVEPQFYESCKANSQELISTLCSSLTDVDVNKESVAALKKCKVVFVIGGPGSSTKAQCEKIVEKYGYTHLSMDDVLKAEVETGSDRGKEIDEFLKKSELVPVETAVALLKESLLSQATSAKGFLIDGFPQQLDQTTKFEKEVHTTDRAIYLEVSDETMTTHLLETVQTAEDGDANEEVKKRIESFHGTTKPIVDHFEQANKLKKISADGPVEDVFVEVTKFFDELTSDDKSDSKTKNEQKDKNEVDLSDAKVIFIVGGPGSGKGTQCVKIAEKYGFCHISSGDLLRDEAKSDSERGKSINETMQKGELVSLDIVLELLKEKIQNKSKETKCFIIDGYPRQVEQGTRFENEIVACTVVLHFDVSDEVMTGRLVERGKSSGRVDDNDEAIKKRIESFHNETEPVIVHYTAQEKLVKISGEGSVEEVFSQVQTYMDQKSW